LMAEATLKDMIQLVENTRAFQLLPTKQKHKLCFLDLPDEIWDLIVDMLICTPIEKGERKHQPPGSKRLAVPQESSDHKKVATDQETKSKLSIKVDSSSSNQESPLEVLAQLQSYNTACLLKRILIKLGTENLSKGRKDRLLRVFNRIDINNNGKITRSKLATFMEGLGIDYDQAHELTEQLLLDIGTKHKHIRHIQPSSLKEGAVSWDLSQEKVIRKTFNLIADNESHISKENLNIYFHNRVDEINLDQMIREVDMDKDGLISFEEFTEAMKSPLRAKATLKHMSKSMKKRESEILSIVE